MLSYGEVDSAANKFRFSNLSGALFAPPSGLSGRIFGSSCFASDDALSLSRLLLSTHAPDLHLLFSARYEVVLPAFSSGCLPHTRS